jgi:predicted protein tyrosine phosphatase
MNNRLHNATNPNQGSFKRVLCVCSAGLLRSPTLANVLAQKGYNTRSCGSSQGWALIPLDAVLLEWADEVVFVNIQNHSEAALNFDLSKHKVKILDIPDEYTFMHPELQEECLKQYEEIND